MSFVNTLSAKDVFVIGTASLDVLHLANGQTSRAAGGAGLYTALAAHCAGAQTGLFAPKPEPVPELLEAVDMCLEWIGPTISLDLLPRLEIEHHGDGKATLVHASWGAEPQLAPDTMPTMVTAAKIIHIAALSSAERQQVFLEAIKSNRGGGARGCGGAASPPLVSVGTYARLVYGETERVRRLFDRADLFFMNENEAKGLFGNIKQAQTRPGAILFVTMDAEGVLVIDGDHVTQVPGHPVPELDPTGAGDTFCGATLAGLSQGLSPVAAAKEAVKLAAQTVSVIGPEALL